MGDPRQTLSWRSIFVLSLLLLVFCILCGGIIMNSKLDFRLKKDKVSRVIKKPNRNARLRNVTWHIHKQTICLRSETHWKLLLYLDFWSFFFSIFHYFCICGSVIFAREVALDLLVIHRVKIISLISLSWMKHDSAPKIVAWKHKCWVTSRGIPTGIVPDIQSQTNMHGPDKIARHIVVYPLKTKSQTSRRESIL